MDLVAERGIIAKALIYSNIIDTFKKWILLYHLNNHFTQEFSQYVNDNWNISSQLSILRFLIIRILLYLEYWFGIFQQNYLHFL